ncbi:MAG: GDP-mannose 4,6-dehydratase [Nitrospirae bacterium]|nr:GDP-mannose 4,6-dehydratase [Nitrospirota bacterium]
MSTVLVTGAAGFIGSHLCEALVARGQRVVGYDNFDPFYPRPAKERNLAALSGNRHFALVEGDIRDRDKLAHTFRDHGITQVVHLAALAGVRPSIAEPYRYQEVNVAGTAAILECVRDFGTENFVFASSSSVYGNNDKVPFAESDRVDHPISPYAATKKAGELICHAYHHLYGFPVTCLRFFTVYGPRQRPDLAIAKFTRLIDNGVPIPFFGDGATRRDYTYIDDIIQGVLAALDKRAPYAIYNLGESQTTTLLELVRLIQEALGREALIDRQPHQPGDVPVTYADISLARKELGYNPHTLIAEGIPKYVEWYRGQGV